MNVQRMLEGSNCVYLWVLAVTQITFQRVDFHNDNV
jgi:hypothetical protein